MPGISPSPIVDGNQYTVIPVNPFYLLFDEKRNRIYASEPRSNSVISIALPSLEIESRIVLPANTSYLAMDTNYSRLFVGLRSYQVAVVNITRWQVVQNISLPMVPSGLAVDAWNRLYAASTGGGYPYNQLAMVDIATGLVLGALAEGSHFDSSLLQMSRDFRYLYQGKLNMVPNQVVKYEINASGAHFVLENHDLGEGLSDMVLSSNASRLFLAPTNYPVGFETVDGETLSLIRIVGIESSPTGMGLNPAGTRVYVADQSAHVNVFSTASFIRTRRIDVSPYRAHGLLVLEDMGLVVAVASSESGSPDQVLLAINLAYVPTLPTLVPYTAPESGFRLGIPGVWQAETDYALAGDTLDLMALGPVEAGFRTNVIVDSVAGPASESEASLLSYARYTISSIQANETIEIAQPPTIIHTANSKAVVFTIAYRDQPLVQVIGFVANETRARVWIIVGSTEIAAADRNGPLFLAIIQSFEVLAPPASASPIFPLQPTLAYILIGGTSAGIGAGVVVGFFLRKKRKPTPSYPHKFRSLRNETSTLVPNPGDAPDAKLNSDGTVFRWR